jgi:ectoine hydroxylase-related dioxygenase (phytanoyl-CoA dioxygenase family)
MTNPPVPEGVSRRGFLKSAGASPALALAPATVAEKPPASQAIKAELEEYGFVVLHNLIPRRDATRIERRVKDIMSRQPDAGKADQHLPGFFNSLDPKDDPLFLPLVTQPICLQLARDLLGEGFQMTEAGCRWRKPGAPEGPLHPTRPLDSIARAGLPVPNLCFVLAFSWMLNDLTRDMGATLYLPFSHHCPSVPRPGVHYKHLVAVEAPAGSVLVHHSGLWHQFGANTTRDKARVGLMGGYFPFWMDPISVGWQPMKKSVRDRMPKEVQQMNKHVIDG